MASPHRKDREAQLAVIPWYEILEPNPAGSIHSTARDLSNWLLFQLNDGVFQGKPGSCRRRALEETRTPQMLLRARGPLSAT